MPSQFEPTMCWASITGLLAPSRNGPVASNWRHWPASSVRPLMPGSGGSVRTWVLSSAAMMRQMSGSGEACGARGENFEPT